MKPVTTSVAKSLSKFLVKDFRRMFGCAHDEIAERLGSLSRSAIEVIGMSDALYHNMEHTLQVTLVGRDILQGLSFSQRIEPSDYVHLVVACLLHDIGYVRGALSGDTEDEYVIEPNGRKISLPRGSSDAALTVHHVDRSKIFAMERLGNSPFVDAARVADAIEQTKFPPRGDRSGERTTLEARLVQAADLVGQLGDPLYPKKVVALYHEFEEIGLNRQLGYSSPADLVDHYPTFFWDTVAVHIEDGIRLLNLTGSGRRWVAHLHSHVLRAQRGRGFSGPQL